MFCEEKTYRSNSIDAKTLEAIFDSPIRGKLMHQVPKHIIKLPLTAHTIGDSRDGQLFKSLELLFSTVLLEKG